MLRFYFSITTKRFQIALSFYPFSWQWYKPTRVSGSTDFDYDTNWYHAIRWLCFGIFIKKKMDYIQFLVNRKEDEV
jgi:hypothetical protein